MLLLNTDNLINYILHLLFFNTEKKKSKMTVKIEEEEYKLLS